MQLNHHAEFVMLNPLVRKATGRL